MGQPIPARRDAQTDGAGTSARVPIGESVSSTRRWRSPRHGTFARRGNATFQRAIHTSGLRASPSPRFCSITRRAPRRRSVAERPALSPRIAPARAASGSPMQLGASPARRGDLPRPISRSGPGDEPLDPRGFRSSYVEVQSFPSQCRPGEPNARGGGEPVGDAGPWGLPLRRLRAGSW